MLTKALRFREKNSR